MKWFRKSLMWASIGCLGASASAQDVVTLGRPTPLPNGGPASEVRVVNAFVPIQPRPTVVRASGLPIDNEVQTVPAPRELPALPEVAPIGAVEGETKPAKSVPPAIKDNATPVALDRLSGDVAPRPTGATCDCYEPRGSSIFDGNFGGRDRFYANGEFLLWWTRGMRLPPLVTTAPATDPEATRAALGFGGTQVLYGNNETSGGASPGARFTAGYYLDDCGLFAIEGNYFFLGRKNDSALFTSNQYPVLGRPFYDINDGVQSRQLTTSPGINPGDVFKANGSIGVNTSSDLQGVELNLRGLLWREGNLSITGLVGFRYLDLNEQLNIAEHLYILKDFPVNPPNLPINAGDQITVSDQFRTHNQFFGAQIGAVAEWNFGRWFVEGGIKLAIGDTFENVGVDGSQRIQSVNGSVQRFVGGLYAASSNIGSHSQARFGFVPETNLRLGYQLTNNVRVFVGYDFLYWSSVLRPGDQIDQTLDLNRVPNSGAPFAASTQVRPIVPYRPSGYWATGVNMGVEFRY